MTNEGTSTLLGQILIDQGVISMLERHEVVCKQWNTGLTIGEIVLGLGYATADQLSDALSHQYYRRWQRRF